jgi:hypothetical protein
MPDAHLAERFTASFARKSSGAAPDVAPGPVSSVFMHSEDGLAVDAPQA